MDAHGSKKITSRPTIFPFLAVGALLLLAIAIVFGQTASHDFVAFDDDAHVHENVHVVGGLTMRGVARAFVDGPGGEWYPLAQISHMADVELFGLHAGGHHLTNVVLHAMGTIVLFLAMLRMTGEHWASAFVAALFAVHPLHVESVAWVAERRDVLSGLFFMLALCAYVDYVRRPGWPRAAIVAVLFALGLLAKPILVTLPFLLLVLDYWPFRRMRRGRVAALVLEKAHLFVLSLAASIITMATHAKGDAAVDRIADLPLWARAANGLVAYATYLWQFVYPVGLVPHYPHPGTAISLWKVAAAAAVLGAITVLVVRARRAHPHLLVGWLWYLGLLVPVIGLVQVGTHAMADRYTYLSQIGLYIAVAWAGLHASRVWRSPRWTVQVAGVGALLLLTGCAWKQTTHWRNSETLWTHAVHAAPPNAVTEFNYGLAMESKGDAARAMAAYERAIDLDPAYAHAHSALAILLSARGETTRALAHFERAVALMPRDAAVHSNLATALVRAGRTDEAIARFQAAVALNPDLLMAQYALAGNLLRAGRAADAARHYEAAVRLDPRFAPARAGLGDALATLGRSDEAMARYGEALQLDPNLAEAHFSLGLELFRRGKRDEAEGHWRQSIRLEPGRLLAMAGLAWTRATSPDPSERDGHEAVALAQLANEISGGGEPALLDVVAASLAEVGDFSAAIDTAGRAYQLASARGERAQAVAIRARVRLYEARRPYRRAP